ncbi:hypothetical protein J6590_053110 [Homalodisca vitripennis]|nr:hypothetical protein J6590_053110 [Homalodisca vitripennis]
MIPYPHSDPLKDSTNQRTGLDVISFDVKVCVLVCLCKPSQINRVTNLGIFLVALTPKGTSMPVIILLEALITQFWCRKRDMLLVLNGHNYPSGTLKISRPQEQGVL